MAEWEYIGSTIKTAIPKRPKKITGGRFAAILGLHPWKSEFTAWCEIVRLAEEPFEENKYTRAGTIVEKSLIDFCKQNISPYVYSPSEFFGVEDAAVEFWYDFFGDKAASAYGQAPIMMGSIFGGMWDALVLDKALGKGGTPIAVIEAKTSSRPQDWVGGVPVHYAAQGALYARLIGVESVYFPVALMSPNDYDSPEKFVATTDNTMFEVVDLNTFNVNGAGIDEMLAYADGWWQRHVVTGVSPRFDENRDEKILAILRTSVLDASDDEALAEIAAKAIELEESIAVLKKSVGIDAMEREARKLKEAIKNGLAARMSDTDSTVCGFGWRLTKSVKEVVDEGKLKETGLWDEFKAEETTYRLAKEKKS